MNFPNVQFIVDSSPTEGGNETIVADYPNIPTRIRFDKWQPVQKLIDRYLRPIELPQDIYTLLEQMSMTTSVILVRNLPLQWLLTTVEEAEEDDWNDPLFEPPVIEIMTSQGIVYDCSGARMTTLPDELIGKLQFGDMIDFECCHQASGVHFVGLDNKSLVKGWRVDVGQNFDYYLSIPRTITQHMDDAGYRYNWHNGCVHGFEVTIHLNQDDLFLKTLLRSRRGYESIADFNLNARDWRFDVMCQPQWCVRVTEPRTKFSYGPDPTHTFPLQKNEELTYVLDDIAAWDDRRTRDFYGSL